MILRKGFTFAIRTRERNEDVQSSRQQLSHLKRRNGFSLAVANDEIYWDLAGRGSKSCRDCQASHNAMWSWKQSYTLPWKKQNQCLCFSFILFLGCPAGITIKETVWGSHLCCRSACSTCWTCSTSTDPGGHSFQRNGTASSSQWQWRPPAGCYPLWHRTGLLPWSCTSWAEITGPLQSN